MTDRDRTHPRTRADLDAWRLRTIRRRDAMSVRKTASRQGNRVAVVTDVNEFGDVQIDRLSGEGGGEWLTTLNGRTPRVGESVVIANVEGAPAVIGPITDGAIELRYSDEIPVFSDITGIGPNASKLYISPHDFPIDVGGPFRFGNGVMQWHSHFERDTPGREYGFYVPGTGSIASITGQHIARLSTGGSSGDGIRLVCRSPEDGWISPSLPMQMTARLEFVQDTSIRVRIGFGGVSDLFQNTPVTGMYFEMDTGVDSTQPYVVIRSGSANIQRTGIGNQGYAWLANVIYRVSSIPVLDTDGVNTGSNVTFERWYEHEADGNQVSHPRDVYDRVLISSHSYFTDAVSGLQNAGVGVRTLTSSARQVDVDLFSGWVIEEAA